MVTGVHRFPSDEAPRFSNLLRLSLASSGLLLFYSKQAGSSSGSGSSSSSSSSGSSSSSNSSSSSSNNSNKSCKVDLRIKAREIERHSASGLPASYVCSYDQLMQGVQGERVGKKRRVRAREGDR